MKTFTDWFLKYLLTIFKTLTFTIIVILSYFGLQKLKGDVIEPSDIGMVLAIAAIWLHFDGQNKD